jgi:glycosyltransferase involved in cell wall biosynthesis
MNGARTPSLSVVVPNYNHARYLPQSLGAIASQLRPTDELIVVDDASTDDSRQVIQELAARFAQIRPVFLEKNIGAAATINYGLKLMTNEYVYFGGADDYVLPGFVDAMMAAAASYPQAGLITSDPGYLRAGAEAIEINRMPFGQQACYFDPQATITVEQELRSNLPIASHASVLRRQSLIDAGGFIPELDWCSDWFANFVIIFREGFSYVPKNIAVMRTNAFTLSAVGMSSRVRRRPVMLALARLLNDRFVDVRSAFVASGVLTQFDQDMLRLALQSREALALVRPRDIWFSAKRALLRVGFGHLIPASVKAGRRRRAYARVGRMTSLID